MFPPHIARVLDSYGVAADTKAALYDLYVAMGSHVLEVFAEIAESAVSVADLKPEDTLTIRDRVVRQFLMEHHPRWLEGKPTPSLWHPREAEGRASGAAFPLGEIPPGAAEIVGPGQPLPDGVLLLGRNAHYGGRRETISFDVIPRELDDALAVGTAEGQQHTLPGSVGATSGTFDGGQAIALIWEIQPNVYKPADDRNRTIAKVYRRHRNWHLVTLLAALEWLSEQKARIFVLRGSALAIAHEVNPRKPVSKDIASLHDRTLERVTSALGLRQEKPTDVEEIALLDSCVLNHALRKHVLTHGAAVSIAVLRR